MGAMLVAVFRGASPRRLDGARRAHRHQLALAREQQLSALGGQAAAAAHLLGTPLATISVIKELVRELPDGSPLEEDARELLAQAKRCRDLLAGLGQRGARDDRHRTFTRAPFTSLLEHIAAEYARPGSKR